MYPIPEDIIVNNDVFNDFYGKYITETKVTLPTNNDTKAGFGGQLLAERFVEPVRIGGYYFQ